MFSDHKFFAAFMEDDQKVTGTQTRVRRCGCVLNRKDAHIDLRIGDWENISEGDESLKTREMDYVKPLNASFGPKTTKCYLTEENINVDFDDYVTTMTTSELQHSRAGIGKVIDRGHSQRGLRTCPVAPTLPSKLGRASPTLKEVAPGCSSPRALNGQR